MALSFLQRSVLVCWMAEWIFSLPVPEIDVIGLQSCETLIN